MKREIRIFSQELRAAGTDAAPKIEGMAASFGTVADIGSFREVIQRGAFTRTLADQTQEIVALFNHNQDVILGRKSAGTLKLEQDDKGLRFSCSIPSTTAARDVYENLKIGNIRECSFGFGIDDPDTDENWAPQSDGTMLRTLKNVRLFDVSVVTFPAYGGTSASARHVVADYVEARMAGATLAQETEQRRVKAAAMLISHEVWKQSAVEQRFDNDAEAERSRARLIAEARASQ
jgi:HK97 family phage prohead protease